VLVESRIVSLNEVSEALTTTKGILEDSELFSRSGFQLRGVHDGGGGGGS